MVHNLILIINIRIDPFYDHLTERGAHLIDRLLSRIRMHDQLRQHRIIVCRNRITAVDRSVDPHAFSSRKVEIRDRSRGRAEIFIRILGIDPALDRMSGQNNILLPLRQWKPGGDPDLFLDQIDPGHPLCHRMFYLDARIHLHKIKLPVAV